MAQRDDAGQAGAEGEAADLATVRPDLARPPRPPAPVDRQALGLGDEPLTAPVEAALGTLSAEVAALREQTRHLALQLAEAKQLADRDPLTAVFNRRAFMRELRRAIAFCERYDTSFGLIYFDLDDFKGVNDRFGHAAGDAALQAVADALAGRVRESDVVGRLGGDEFAVILAQAGLDGAMIRAAQLAASIEAEPFVWQGRSIPLRITHGVRGFERGTEPQRLLAEADAAMFVRKGRRGA